MILGPRHRIILRKSMQVPADELPGRAELLQEVPAGVCQHPQAAHRRHTSSGEGQPRLRAARGCGAAAGGQLCGPPSWCWRRAKGLQAAAGEEDGGGEPGPAEAPQRHLRPLSLHAGGGPPGGGAQDLLHDFGRSPGSSVKGT